MDEVTRAVLLVVCAVAAVAFVYLSRQGWKLPKRS